MHPFQRLLCWELSGNERFQVGGGSCSLQRPLHKGETCLSLSAYYEFLQRPQISWVPDKMFFFEQVKKSVDLVLNLFGTQMIPNTLLLWKLRKDLIEPSEIRSLKIILMIDHPIRGSSVTDIAMIKFLSFSCSFSWKMFHSVYNNCNNNNCKMRLMLVRIAISFKK